MPPRSDVDLGVDVLIIGGGVQGLYLARSLHPRYSVCVVADPRRPPEDLDSNGLFSAGYDGNDVVRIQPARRSAGYWRLWAESNGLELDLAPGLFVVDPDDEGDRLRLWSDATLVAHPAERLPSVFDGGTLDAAHTWATPNDVVLDPAAVVAKLRDGIDHRFVWGEVNKFGLITDHDIEFVEVQTMDGTIIPITPRFVVLADDVHNGALLQRLVAMFKDRTKRREATDTMRSCQAVRRRTTVAVRGDLEPVAGSFGGLEIVAHRGGGGDGDDVVWLVSPPIDDGQTVLGPEDARFDPALDATLVRSTIDTLLAISPTIARRAEELRWGVYVARKTEHPMMAAADTSNLAQPAPARLESLDMDSFLAAWPSHIGYAMIVGDVVAERIEAALGGPGQFADGLQPSDVAGEAPTPLAHWQRDDFVWNDWATFSSVHGIVAG